MAVTPSQPGDDVRLDRGIVWRRIPRHLLNRKTGKPDLAAFMPRQQDKGATSTILKTLASEEQARTNFGKLKEPWDLCEIDIAQAIEVTRGAVSFWKRQGMKRSPRDAHVRLYGCTVDAVAALIASIAEVVPKVVPKVQK